MLALCVRKRCPCGRLFRQIVAGRRSRHAPAQRLVLCVAFAELPGDLCARELHTQVERVCRIVAYVEQWPQRERIVSAMMPGAVERMDAILRDHDAEAGIAYRRSKLGDL